MDELHALADWDLALCGKKLPYQEVDVPHLAVECVECRWELLHCGFVEEDIWQDDWEGLVSEERRSINDYAPGSAGEGVQNE